MCGLVGIVMKQKGKQFPFALFEQLMGEARIRGQHATGVSYFNTQKFAWGEEYFVDTVKEPVPADKFRYPNMWLTEAAIGHLRYSTSDLEYNQPNAVDQLSIVHNGVVTQEPHAKWEELFGVKCRTKNDSEILMRLMIEGKTHPLELVNTSQACIALLIESDQLVMKWWRNEQRPLYFIDLDEYIIVTSTKDIINRVVPVPLRLFSVIQECVPCTEYSFVVDREGIYGKPIRKPLEDLQHVR